MAGREIVVVLRTATTSPGRSRDLFARAASDEVHSVLRNFSATARPLFGIPLGAPSAAERAQESGELNEILRDQSRYFLIDVAEDRSEELLAELQSKPSVEAAYVKPLAENPLAPRSTSREQRPETTETTVPDFIPRQGYLGPAPAGVDATYAWTKKGGRGDDVRVIDIEGAWQFSHIDLLENEGGLIGGDAYAGVDWRNHGTAVLGEIGGDDNRLGICGIAPKCFQSAISHGSLGSAGAINLAAQKLRRGDIILLEMHRPGPRYAYQSRPDQKGYIAVEWWPDDLLAIRFAIAKGIVVVEAAGNGEENLDHARYDNPGPGFPSSWKNPFRTLETDVAAVMVGAGAPPSGAWGPDRSKLDFSNFGSRVDCQGWGREVVTIGYGDLFRNSGNVADENFWYTSQFSGTSSASPIVTGAIACLQGMAKAKGALLSPVQIRQALRTTGSPQQFSSGAPPNELIGPRPDLRDLMQHFVGVV